MCMHAHMCVCVYACTRVYAHVCILFTFIKQVMEAQRLYVAVDLGLTDG